MLPSFWLVSMLSRFWYFPFPGLWLPLMMQGPQWHGVVVKLDHVEECRSTRCFPGVVYWSCPDCVLCASIIILYMVWEGGIFGRVEGGRYLKVVNTLRKEKEQHRHGRGFLGKATAEQLLHSCCKTSNAGGWKAWGSGVGGINITLDVQEKTNCVYLLRRMKNSFPRFFIFYSFMVN